MRSISAAIAAGSRQRRRMIRRSAGQRWCQARWLLACQRQRSGRHAPPSVFSEASLSPSFLRTTPAKNPRTECDCQPVDFHDGGDRGPVRPAQQRQHPRLLGIRSRPVMRSSALASGGLGPGFGGGARLDRPRTLALGHVKTPLHGIGATARRTTQTPRRPNGAGGVRGASRLRRLSVPDHILAPFTTEVECKITVASLRISRSAPTLPSPQFHAALPCKTKNAPCSLGRDY